MAHVCPACFRLAPEQLAGKRSWEYAVDSYLHSEEANPSLVPTGLSYMTTNHSSKLLHFFSPHLNFSIILPAAISLTGSNEALLE